MNKLEKLSKILDPKEILEPNRKAKSALKTLLDKRLDELTVSKPNQDIPAILWGANRYGLDQSQTFLSLSEIKKKHNI